MPFTHLDEQGKPGMVDVSGKGVTKRTATATAIVVLGEDILRELTDNDMNTKKGSIVQTAIIAGTMAVKQTWSVIPLCHAIPILGCKIAIEGGAAGALEITCAVTTEGKTGVEMEALIGLQVALATIYDMCKAVDRGMVIGEIKLLEKAGGKSGHYRRDEAS